jgi:hypothetical protein
MANATSTQLQELYVAYFGRAADPTGIDYWTNKGTSQAAFAAHMHAQNEFQANYGTKNVEAQVNQIYKNLFDREADVTGLEYWTLQINLGNLKVAEIATHLIYAAQNNSGSEADKTALSNRTAAAVAYTAEVRKTTADILAYAPTTTDPWVAGDNITEAVSYLSGIDGTTEFTAAGVTASVDKFTATSSDTAKTYVLTTGVDSFTGLSADDSFQTQMDATATLNTAGLLDTVDGGAGTDTLLVVNTTANAVSTALQGTNITNIETFDYRATAGGNLDFDTAGSATTFKLTNLTGTSDFSDVRTTDTVSFVNGGAALDTTVTYNAASVTGTADSDTIVLNGITAGADIAFVGAVETITLDVDAASSLADLVFASTTTAVNIDAAAALSVTTTLTNAGVTTYTVTGSGTVDLAPALGAAAVTYDAGAATGIQDILVGATNTTITTGSADDVVDMSTNLTYQDIIDLGAGSDTIRVDLTSLSAGATDLNVSNTETLRLDNTTSNSGAIQMDNFAVDTVRFDDGTARTGVLTLTDLPTTTTAFTMIAAGTADADPQFNRAVVDYDTSTTQTAATLTISNDGTVADDIFVGKFDIDRMEKLTITGTDIGQAAADELTLDEIEGDHMTDLVVVADGEVIVTDIDLALADTLDFTAADKGVTVTAVSDAATAVTITMGDGNDSVTMTKNIATETVTVDLGAGNDTFVSTDETDTITTGTGIDTIRFQGDGSDDANIITDFTAGAGGDVIDFATSAVTDSDSTEIAVSTLGTITGASIGLANGATIVNVTYTGALTSTAVAADLTAESIVSFNDEDDNYIIIDNGTDTGIFLFVDNQIAAIAAAELTLIATLQGVDDATDLTAANFAYFI